MLGFETAKVNCQFTWEEYSLHAFEYEIIGDTIKVEVPSNDFPGNVTIECKTAKSAEDMVTTK